MANKKKLFYLFLLTLAATVTVHWTLLWLGAHSSLASFAASLCGAGFLIPLIRQGMQGTEDEEAKGDSSS